MNTVDRVIAKSLLKDVDVEPMRLQPPAHAIGGASSRGIRHNPTCHPGRAHLSRPWMKRSREIVASSTPVRDKSCIVVGATRGIGLEFTKQLLARQNTVHATARSLGHDTALLDLQKASPKLTVGLLDIADPKSIAEWAEDLESRATGPFDYVFVVAGVVDDWADLEEVTEDRMLHCFRTNAVGPLLTTQSLVTAGLVSKGSIVANMTSKMGSLADNSSGGSYAYRASKAAINQITKSLSIDLADQGIQCVLLHPGFVRTSMTHGHGLIDPPQSVAALLDVLESGVPLNGKWYDWKHEEIPW